MNLYLIKKMKIKFILISALLTLLTSCADVGKALRNEKSKTTDEFLIEKRGPLSIPPDMGKLPKPNSDRTTTLKNTDIFKKGSDNENSNEKSRLENILLEEIKKN